MLITIVFVISLLIILADWLAYKRYLRTSSCAWAKRVFVAMAIASNLLPYLAAAMMWLDITLGMVSMMWLLTVYTVFSLSRLALYAGILTIKNRYAKWVVGLTLCGVVATLLIVGVVHTRKYLTVNSVIVSSSHLPKAFDGYRILLFSDLHIGSLTSAEQMCESVVERVNSLDVDLVVFGGDLVNVSYEELSPKVAEILSKIKARDGVVAVLGNHDTGVYARDTIELPIEKNTRLLIEGIEAMGWRVLNDDTEYICRGLDSVSLTGIGFSRELLEHRHSANVADSLDLQPIYEGVSCDKFNVTISHMPQLWRKVAALGCGDLVLSGHVHSMQVKGHIGSWSFSPAQLMYREWSGLYEEQGSHLYITDGVGSVGFHLRLGAPPEIADITLRCE